MHTVTVRRRLLWGGIAAIMLLVIMGLLTPIYFASRFGASVQQRSQDFRYIIDGLRTWQVTYGKLPEAVYRNVSGTPCYSWRLSILRYIESRDYAEDVPWDDERNKRLAAMSHSVFCSRIGRDEKQTVQTTVCAITGQGTAFDGGRQARLEDFPPDLIIFIEVANSGIHWMAPGDLNVSDIPPTIGQGTSGKGVMIGFSDGSVWFIRACVPVATLERFFTIRGAKDNDREHLLGPYRLASWQGRNGDAASMTR